MSRFAKKAVALGSALTLAMSLVGSAFAGTGDGTTEGTTSGTTPTISTVVQQTTQTASNTAIIIQTGTATSGAAVAGPGSTAKSGEAETKLSADVDQKVNQTADTSGASLAVAGASNTVAASTTQAGSNTANLAQSGDAVSGVAVATGTNTESAGMTEMMNGQNAKATSGDAKVEVKASQNQQINQNTSTKGNEALEVKSTTLAASSTTQLASNTAVDYQTAVAASGAAVATGRNATASSGDVKAKAKLDVDQFIDQDATVKATNALGAGTSAVAAQSALQVGANVADAAQVSLAASGPAVAIVVGGIKFDNFEFVRGVEAKSGEAEASVDTDQFQSIDQDADTFVSMFGALDLSDEGGATGALAATGVTQLASNTSIVFQDALAVSGAAAATQIDGGTKFSFDSLLEGFNFGKVSAKSGEAEVHLFVDDDQFVDQDSLNKIDQDFVLGAIALSTQGVLQIEDNFNCVPPQDGIAMSGEAIAIGDKFGESKAKTGEAEVKGRIDKDQGVDDPQSTSLLHWQILAAEWPFLFLGGSGTIGLGS